MKDIDVLDMIVDSLIDDEDRGTEVISWLVNQLTKDEMWTADNITRDDADALQNLLDIYNEPRDNDDEDEEENAPLDYTAVDDYLVAERGSKS